MKRDSLYLFSYMILDSSNKKASFNTVQILREKAATNLFVEYRTMPY